MAEGFQNYLWEVSHVTAGVSAMTAASTYTANELLDHVLRNAAYTAPSSLWIGLFTSSAGLDSNTSGSWTEVSMTGYARVEIGGTSGNAFSVAASGASDNDNDINFATVTAGGPETVTHVGIMDASSAGNCIFWGALSASRTLQNNDTFKFLAGALDVAMT